MGGIGFLDDYLKLKQKREGKKNRGLVERYKLAGQVTIGVRARLVPLAVPAQSRCPARPRRCRSSSTCSSCRGVGFAWLYVPFVTFVIDGHQQRREPHRRTRRPGHRTVGDRLGDLRHVRVRDRPRTTPARRYLQLFYLRGAGELTVFCRAMFGALHRLPLVQLAPGGGVHGRHRLAGPRRRARRGGDPAQVASSWCFRRRRVRRRDDVGDPAALGVQVRASAGTASSTRRSIACSGERRCTITSS